MKFCPFWRQTKKGQYLRNQTSYTHQIWFPCISHQSLLAWFFWANSIFWPPWTIVHGSMRSCPWSEREIWLNLKAKKKKQNVQNQTSYTHQNWLACISHRPLLACIRSISPWSEGKFCLFWRQTFSVNFPYWALHMLQKDKKEKQERLHHQIWHNVSLMYWRYVCLAF